MARARIAHLPSDEDDGRVRREHALALRPRPAPRVVEHQVVALVAPGEVLPGVVDDVIGAERSHEVDVPRAAHRGHLRAERFRDLHGERPDASRGAVDQDLLPRLKLPLVAKTLERGNAATGTAAASSNVTFAGFSATRVASADVLRKGAAPPAEHLVARAETGDVPADGFDRAGEVAAMSRDFGLRSPISARATRSPIRPYQSPRVQRRRVDAHEHTVVREIRLFDLPKLKTSGVPYVSRTIACMCSASLNRTV